MTNPNTAEVSAEHAIWPQDPQFELALAGGVTTMHILPGSGNLFGGRSVTVKNVPARTADAMKFPGAPYGLKMACGENPMRVYGGAQHARRRRGWATSPAIARPGSRRPSTARRCARGRRADPDPTKRPDRNLQLETLMGVLDGEIRVQNHCYRADEMATMIDIAKEFGFKIASFHHAVEAYKVRDLLAANDICGSMWADWWGFKLEAYDGITQNIALVHEAGGCAIVHSDSADGIQRLNQEAAKAIRAGAEAGITIDRADAVKWISDQSGEGARHRQGHRLARAGQERRRRDLVGRSVQRLRARRAGLHRRRAGLRSRGHRRGVPRSDFQLGQSCPVPAPVRVRSVSVSARPAPTAADSTASAAAVDRGTAGVLQTGEVVAITNARIHPVSGPAIERGTIVIRGGRIAAVGANVTTPAGARVIDAGREDRHAGPDRLRRPDRHRRDPAVGRRGPRTRTRPTPASARPSTSSTRSTATRR